MILWLLLIFFIPGVYLSVAISKHLCDESEIKVYYIRPLEIYNQYTLFILIPAETQTLILKFDSEVRLEIYHNQTRAFAHEEGTSYQTKIYEEKLVTPRYSYRFTFVGNEDFELELQVFGPASGTIPYLESALRDNNEICTNPKHGFMGYYLDKSCGRLKITHTQLIVHGQSTEPGDWPWHVAIFRLKKSSFEYICGGTLVTKTLVLTAAHCASIRGNAVIPDILSVHLGKHHLIGGDIGAQEREVFRVIIHPNFNGSTLDNDIALLKLRSEAAITDYVQPACLWNKIVPNKLPANQSIFGTVVGWGFNSNDSLSSTLQKTNIPIVSELTCLKSNPTFFHQRVNDHKFCAGFANGTSVCNGDSGGGLMVFVPDWPGDTASGGWHVRGIVSIALRRTGESICDPYQYTVFTDVEKYRDWVLDYME